MSSTSSKIKDYEAVAYCARQINISLGTIINLNESIGITINNTIADSWEGQGKDGYFPTLQKYLSSDATISSLYESISANVGAVASQLKKYNDLDETLKTKLNDIADGNADDILGAICGATTADIFEEYLSSRVIKINGIDIDPGGFSEKMTYVDENGEKIEFYASVPKTITSDTRVLFYYCGSGELNDPAKSRIAQGLKTGEYESDDIIIYVKGNENPSNSNFAKNKGGITNKFIKQICGDSNVDKVGFVGFSAGGKGIATTFANVVNTDLGDIKITDVYLFAQTYSGFNDETNSIIEEKGIRIWGGYSTGDTKNNTYGFDKAAKEVATDGKLVILEGVSHGDSETKYAEETHILRAVES